MDTIFDEGQRLRDSALALLVGKKIGGGATRNVYELLHIPNLVIKIEYASKRFCNVAEYDIWTTVKGTKFERFFAPVVDIDVWAGALIMERTQPITEAEFDAELKRLPSFMCDVHWANFGRLNGKIVCHDYGYHNAIFNAVKEAKTLPLKKVKASS